MFTHFYHATMRKIVIAFGSIMNNITLVRIDKNGVEKLRLRVPLAYAAKDKLLQRAQQDPEIQKNIAMTLPRMSFEITGLKYHASRKLPSTYRNSKVVSSDVKEKEFTPVPYDVDIRLTIMVKNAEDGAQIVEQILPYFVPEYTVNIIAVPELDLKDDVPIILNSVTKEDSNIGEFVDRRILMWTLDFTVLANFYGPNVQEKVIKKAQVDTHQVNGAGAVTDEEVDQTPRHYRATVTPDPITATAEDDYGFSVDVEEFWDNKKYNPVTDTDDEII